MLTTALFLLSTACTPSAVQAPYGSSVVTPANLNIGWTSSYQAYDLAGFVSQFDVLVLGPEGTPLQSVKVDITTGYGGVYVVPQESIELVGYPTVPSNIQSQDDIRKYCVDSNGNYTLVEDWCAWYWDTVNDEYYAFSGTYADAYTETDSGGQYWFAPTFMSGTTNASGILNGYLLIDTMPSNGDDSYSDVDIVASIGVDSDSFSVVVAN